LWFLQFVAVAAEYPQIIHFNRIIHYYKPFSYWGTPIYGNPHFGSSINCSSDFQTATDKVGVTWAWAATERPGDGDGDLIVPDFQGVP
jgi:hypothetical protein